jgi:undecaprenyl-diphosphatase
MIGNDANHLVEQILPYERSAFLWLNSSHNLFWDSFMWIYSSKYTWIPLAIVAIAVFIYKTEWRKSFLFILCVILLITLCDQLSAGVIKSIFERYRPTHHPDFADCVKTVNNYHGGRYGFVSAHSANGFGIAMFMSLIFKYRKLSLTLFAWAALSAYSRIYLGVHFISDIIGGMILGLLLGCFMYMIFRYGRIKILKQNAQEALIPAYTTSKANALIYIILITIITIFIISMLNFIFHFRLLF